MPLNAEIASWIADMKAVRHRLHTNPEVGTGTVGTVAFVKEQLRSYGVGFEDIGENSLLARIEGRGPGKTVALRGDMDALETQEETGLPYQSAVKGRAHACGHDGHTATLLAVARHLAGHRDFDGAVLLLFQSGEEGYDGALKVIEDGLFEKHDIDFIFGLHNWPGYATDQVVVHFGAAMASEDRFEILVRGKSGHASMPHGCVEPFAAVADIVKSAQSIVGRKVSAHDKAVVSITQVHGGSADNIIPDEVVIHGNVRTCDGAVQDLIEESLGRVAEGVARMYGVEATLTYRRKHPVLVNTMPEPARAAAAAVVGEDNVLTGELPVMGSEDFAFYLRHVPGCFLWVGNGKDSALLHNSKYDFNDEVILVGASVFVELVRQVL
ncbi:amidohydrolase [Paucidesulfovibrio longus]|uniref:amidohydrolase n=1 Tax=Paucidesulfovibrio longus TaxID=889 RepID=UPI0003B30E58|nr:amidohydrolase [Paucidesulfovibrio longus]